MPTPPAARPRRTTAALIGGCLVSLAALLAIVVSPAGADEISDKRAEAQRIASQLSDLRERQMALEGDYNDANLKLAKANDDIATAKVRVDAVAKEYEQRKGEARLYAVQAYVRGNDSPTVDALLTSEGDTGPRKQGYLQAASGNREDMVDQLNASRHKLDEEIAKLDAAKSDAQAATDKASRAKADNDKAVAEQNSINARVQGELGDLVHEEEARQAEATRQANEAKLAQLRAAAPAPATTAPAPSTTAAGPNDTAGRTPTTTAPRPTTPTNPTTPTKPPAPPQPPPVPPSGKGAAAASYAMSMLGVPYVYGGASPSGFDCSGLVMWAYAQVGVSLPHATSAQWAATAPISMSDLQVGDLVFFYGMGHDAIYIGGGRVVHAPHTGDVVRTEAIANMPVTGARRVL